MIEIRNLYKQLGPQMVLNGLNLNVARGETKVVIGRSGVGKTVLLKNIVGLMSPDSGSIKINGVEVTTLNENEYNKLRMEIGMVFQGGALFDSMNVGENVGFVLSEFMNLDKKTFQDRVRDALGLVGLKDVERMMPSQLSGGMRKRVSLARVLCMEPHMILYDEPTTGVDPITASAINHLIMELRDKLKVTSIVVTHDMNSAYTVGDSIAMFYKGQIIADGTPEEIKNSKDQVIQQFIHGEARGPITEDERLIFGHVK